MSQEVHLTTEDYSNIADWYAKAFGKNNDSKDSDDKTLAKISIMGLAYLDDLKAIECED